MRTGRRLHLHYLHRECLWEVSRCRHAAAALGRILLLRPTEMYACDPEQCRLVDDSSDYPGVSDI